MAVKMMTFFYVLAPVGSSVDTDVSEKHGDKFLWNVGNYLRVYTVPRPRTTSGCNLR